MDEGQSPGAFVFRHAWSIAAALCLLAAFISLLLGWPSAAFVVATLGVVAWFLNLRGQLQQKNLAAEASRAEIESDLQDEDTF